MWSSWLASEKSQGHLPEAKQEAKSSGVRRDVPNNSSVSPSQPPPTAPASPPLAPPPTSRTHYHRSTQNQTPTQPELYLHESSALRTVGPPSMKSSQPPNTVSSKTSSSTIMLQSGTTSHSTENSATTAQTKSPPPKFHVFVPKVPESTSSSNEPESKEAKKTETVPPDAEARSFEQATLVRDDNSMVPDDGTQQKQETTLDNRRTEEIVQRNVDNQSVEAIVQRNVETDLLHGSSVDPAATERENFARPGAANHETGYMEEDKEADIDENDTVHVRQNQEPVENMLNQEFGALEEEEEQEEIIQQFENCYQQQLGVTEVSAVLTKSPSETSPYPNPKPVQNEMTNTDMQQITPAKPPIVEEQKNDLAIMVKSPYSFHFVGDEQRVQREWNTWEEIQNRQRREWRNRIHSLECKTAQLYARVVNENMERSRCLERPFLKNNADELKNLFDRISMIQDEYRYDATGSSPSSTDSTSEGSIQRWRKIESRLSALDTHMTKSIHQDLTRVRRNELTNSMMELLELIKEFRRQRLEAAAEVDLPSKIEDLAGRILCGPFREEHASRCTSIELAKQALEQPEKMGERETKRMMEEIQTLRQDLSRQRQERIKQDELISHLIDTKAQEIKRALLEAVGDPNE